MKNYLNARKRRQLKYIAKRIRKLLVANDGVINTKIERLSLRLSKALKRSQQIISTQELKKALGAAAIIFGLALSNGLRAQNFAPFVANPFGLDTIRELAIPSFVDLDADGDLDLFVGQYGDQYIFSNRYNNFLYYENVGTTGTPVFGTPIVNPIEIDPADEYIIVPDFADIDADGDMDLIVGNFFGALQFYENIGSETAPEFAAPITNPAGLDSVQFFASPNFVDLDADGDMDLLVGEQYVGMNFDSYSNLVFFENTGTPTSPQFAPGLTNPFGLIRLDDISIPSVADIDGDGDMDILLGRDYSMLIYFENTGSATDPAFAAPINNPFGIMPEPIDYLGVPELIDVDLDGDVDLVTSGFDDAIKFYENTVKNPVGLKEIAPVFDFEVFPNPAQSTLLIRTPEDLEQLEIFDLLGRRQLVFSNNEKSIALEHLPSGIYTLRAKNKEGEIVLKKIQKL